MDRFMRHPLRRLPRPVEQSAELRKLTRRIASAQRSALVVLLFLALWRHYLRRRPPADVDIPVGDAWLDLVGQVLALAAGGRLDLRREALEIGFAPLVELDLGLRLLLEPELLGLRDRPYLDIGLVFGSAAHASTASRTSLTVIRPSAPVPSISSMSRPASCAAFSAAGVALCFSALRCLRRSPSSLAFRAAALPSSFISSDAAAPISCATVLTTTFATE